MAPETIKSVIVRQPGGLDALELIETPLASPGPGQIQFRATAFGVGHPDVLIRKGTYKAMPPLPVNPGNDAAGYVTAIGEGVAGIVPGQKVLLSARDLSQRGGCYAEYIVAPADAVHLLPEAVDPADSVCLGNYQVAWALLNECAGSHPVSSVLVIGAAGGVGTSLVQLAKRAGMMVIGTVSSPEKAEFARSNGADEIIFYRTEDVIARTRELTGGGGVGMVLDHVCGPAFSNYLGALARWGMLVSYGTQAGLPNDNLIAALRKHGPTCAAIRCFDFHGYDDDAPGRRAIMRELIAALAQRLITPRIAARFQLTEVRDAHAMLESGASLGKIIMVA